MSQRSYRNRPSDSKTAQDAPTCPNTGVLDPAPPGPSKPLRTSSPLESPIFATLQTTFNYIHASQSALSVILLISLFPCCPFPLPPSPGGPMRAPTGEIAGRLGAVLGRLGMSWGRLGMSWRHLGAKKKHSRLRVAVQRSTPLSACPTCHAQLVVSGVAADPTSPSA